MPDPTALSYCGGQVRVHDPDRFLTALFAPPDRRESLFALYAFNLEVARTRELVSEGLIGRIRLHWWREALDGIYAGAPRQHEVAQALGTAVGRHGLERAALDALIDAREQDVDEAPPRDLPALLVYAEATGGGLARLAATALGGDGPAQGVAHEIGTAWALTGLLRAVRFHARARRQYLPLDLMAREGVTADELFALRPSPGLARVAEPIAAAARERLGAARAKGAPRAALAAVLPAVLADGYLRRLARLGHDVLAPAMERRLAAAPLRLWLANARGRF